MAAMFQLQVFTRERMVLDEQVSSIIVPALTGYLGVMARHAPLIAVLGEGRLTIKHDSLAERTFQLAGGFLEVRDNVATILADQLTE